MYVRYEKIILNLIDNTISDSIKRCPLYLKAKIGDVHEKF